MNLNFYEVLNVKSDATLKDIKKAYRILAKKYHPDTYEGNKEFAEKKMQEINIAYDTLSDDSLRSSYDQKNGINIKKEDDFYKTTTSSNSNSNFRNATYYKNTYDKDGVNYEVKYRPNTTKVRYDKRGYAESNYYTTKMDDDEYDVVYRKEKIKELLTGKNLIYTIVVSLVIIGVFTLTIYKAVDSIRGIVESNKNISTKINNSNFNTLPKPQKSEVANESSKNFNDIKNYVKNYVNSKGNEVTNSKTTNIEYDKEELLEKLGITDSEDKKAILDFIESLNEN